MFENSFRINGSPQIQGMFKIFHKLFSIGIHEVIMTKLGKWARGKRERGGKGD